ncbi:MAG: hypothetical protein H7175_20385 [Burkholderiales bacterium]|nr:hypothetical protein [Anaerolineae bacterium]
MSGAVRRYWPYLLLMAVLALVWLAMALRGFNLGFTGDMLGFEYHYDSLGLWSGSRWLLDEWERHLLGTIYSASIHQLFPGQSAAWYAMSFVMHFVVGSVMFLLSDTVLRGRWRWLSFAAALIFVFHTRQIQGHLELPTGGLRKTALALSLLSLWFHLLYVRKGRQQARWHELSLATFFVSVWMYEQTFLFFLLHPVIAYFEETYDVSERGFFGWLRQRWRQLIADSFWYPPIVAVYLFLLKVLFPAGGFGTDVSPSAMLGEVSTALGLEFSSTEFAARILPTFQDDWLMLTLAAALLVFVGILLWRRSDKSTVQGRELWALLVISAALFAANLMSIAPTRVGHDARALYPAAVGLALVVSGGLAWLCGRYLPARIGQAVFAAMVALLVSTGLTYTFQLQTDYIDANVTRQQVLSAIQDAVPDVDEPPYLLILSDAHVDNDLRLNAQDINFPYTFDLMYDIDDAAADAIFYDLTEAPPEADVHGSVYAGPYIVVEDEGIYSPLRPGQAIDPSRLIVVYYDSQTGTAIVLDEVPPEALVGANIVRRAGTPLRTNFGLIG